MIPNTVPNRPTKGAVEPIVASPDKPRRNSAVLIAMARCSARFDASISSPEISDDCSCARNSCNPLLTTMARCDLRCLSLMLIASSMRLFLSACATRGANSRDCFLAAV